MWLPGLCALRCSISDSALAILAQTVCIVAFAESESELKLKSKLKLKHWTLHHRIEIEIGIEIEICQSISSDVGPRCSLVAITVLYMNCRGKIKMFYIYCASCHHQFLYPVWYLLPYRLCLLSSTFASSLGLKFRA